MRWIVSVPKDGIEHEIVGEFLDYSVAIRYTENVYGAEEGKVSLILPGYKEWHVDVPCAGSYYWRGVGEFGSKEEAIEFAYDRYGADDLGNIDLIIAVEDNMLEVN